MKYLGVGPLEFDELPAYHREQALMALSAENWAQSEQMERARKK